MNQIKEEKIPNQASKTKIGVLFVEKYQSILYTVGM